MISKREAVFVFVRFVSGVRIISERTDRKIFGTKAIDLAFL